MLSEIRDGMKELTVEIKENARTLRGRNGTIGIVAEVERLKEREQEMRDDIADIKRQLRLKMFPASDEPASLKARAEAFAIRAGVGLAFLTAIIEAWQWFIGTGGTP